MGRVARASRELPLVRAGHRLTPNTFQMNVLGSLRRSILHESEAVRSLPLSIKINTTGKWYLF